MSPRQTSELGYFNPRSHVGSDYPHHRCRKDCVVSIHLPRGERPSPTPTIILLSCFNPRFHAGSDPNRPRPGCGAGEFQSTRPRGERPRCSFRRYLALEVSIHALTWGATIVLIVVARLRCFNPRSHMGSDSSIPSKFRYSRFQSTLPREERPICFVVTRPRYRVSIHAPTRRAT